MFVTTSTETIRVVQGAQLVKAIQTGLPITDQC